MRPSAPLLALPLLALLACSRPFDEAPSAGAMPASASAAGVAAPTDEALAACSVRWERALKQPAAPGVPGFDARRVAFLGRARGAATLFVREPQRGVDGPPGYQEAVARFAKEPPGLRVSKALARHKRDKPLLRALLLREGYAFVDEPEDAFALEQHVKLVDLFDDARLVLERGAERFELERREGKPPTYTITSGPRAGQTAILLFGDRVRAAADPEAPPLHRDVVALEHDAGFDRLEIEHLGEHTVLARMRFGATWARGVLDADGAKLSPRCLNEPAEVRATVERELAEGAWRRRALAALRAAVTQQVDDALPFDRPREEKGPDKDGQLRPHWTSAYLGGRTSFEVDDVTYPVFHADGRPKPPEVCVDFVVDAWTRASGGWFTPRGTKPQRISGRLDPAALGLTARGVIAFGDFAEEHPELFEVARVPERERVPFADRERFFAYLLKHADDVRPGDVLSIRGLKRDDRVHQHAILLEETDPLTGFPHALADQMKLPRRRTWEGIMAEAPKRSLYYRMRPREVILRALDGGEAAPPALAATSRP